MKLSLRLIRIVIIMPAIVFLLMPSAACTHETHDYSGAQAVYEAESETVTELEWWELLLRYPRLNLQSSRNFG